MYIIGIHLTEKQMKATILDLRYKMKDVLNALDKNEQVTVLYHGKVKGVIVPANSDGKIKKVNMHPFFGSSVVNGQKTVLEELDDLRGSRFDDI
jgi:antitoxin (DNA-binding transcriptional repressor) of toxin-antitoxin stability system